MQKEFLEKIFSCNKCNFENICEKTFYYKSDNPKIAFIMQNPGVIKESKNQEITLSECFTTDSKMNYHVNSLKKWLIKNEDFFSKFLTILINLNSFEYPSFDVSNFKQYVTSGKIYEHIYFTDIVKCSGLTKNFQTSHFDNCIEHLFDHELKHFSNIDLLFIFSTRSWETFKKKYHPLLVKEALQRKYPTSETVSNVHGYLHKATINNKVFYVFPMVHMSPLIFNSLIGDSYFEYLERGILEFIEYKQKEANH